MAVVLILVSVSARLATLVQSVKLMWMFVDIKHHVKMEEIAPTLGQTATPVHVLLHTMDQTVMKTWMSVSVILVKMAPLVWLVISTVVTVSGEVGQSHTCTSLAH